MAGLACQFEDNKGAIFVGTFLTDGTSVAVCEEHVVEFFAGTLQALTGKPVLELLTQPDEVIVDEELAQALAESDPEFDKFIADHADELQELQDGGLTFDEAVAAIVPRNTADGDDLDASLTNDN